MVNDREGYIENSMLTASGSIPVILEGIEHTYATTQPQQSISRHRCHELICMRDGKIEMNIGGDDVTLDKGKMLIIRPQVGHFLTVRSTSADMFILYFGFAADRRSAARMNEAANTATPSASFYEDGAEIVPAKGRETFKTGPNVEIPGNVSQVSLESFLDYTDDGMSGNAEDKEPYIVISGRDKKIISQVVERIVVEKNNDFYSKDVMLQTLTTELMINISRALRHKWEENLKVRTGKTDELVMLAKTFIDDNYDRGINVSDAAGYVFLSQGYFTRAFRERYKISPLNYLMKKKIEKSCELLSREDIKVSAVASGSGFASSQRFNVAFRKYMNMTPLEYRRMRLKDTEE